MAKIFESRPYQQKIHDKAVAYLEAENDSSKTTTVHELDVAQIQ